MVVAFHLELGTQRGTFPVQGGDLGEQQRGVAVGVEALPGGEQALALSVGAVGAVAVNPVVLRGRAPALPEPSGTGAAGVEASRALRRPRHHIRPL